MKLWWIFTKLTYCGVLFILGVDCFCDAVIDSDTGLGVIGFFACGYAIGKIVDMINEKS